jgi:hypothetical protein
MAIKVKIQEPSVKVKISEPNVKVKVHDPNKRMVEFKLMLRRALNGDLMIFDHSDIDIIIMTEKKKVVAFAKDLMSDAVYGAESRLLEHLRKKGIIAFDSIQGGAVYGSLEGKIHESTELDAIKATLYEVSQWMDSERPYFKSREAYDDMIDDYYADPSDEESTELGEVPHEEKKGSILQRGLFAPYLYGKYTY